MINIDKITQINDRYYFIDDKCVPVNKNDALEIFHNARIQHTVYSTVYHDLFYIYDDYIKKGKIKTEKTKHYEKKWIETHDIRCKWNADAVREQATKFFNMADGAGVVLDKIFALSEKYYKLETQAKNVMNNKGWT